MLDAGRVLADDELMAITKEGMVIRMPVKGIRVSGRNTQGVRIVDLSTTDRVIDVARVVPEEEGEGRRTRTPDEGAFEVPDDVLEVPSFLRDS